MNTTDAPLWLTLLTSGGIAVLGTLLGLVFSGRQARQRERERWERDKELRSYERRRDAYSAFYATLWQVYWPLALAVERGKELPGEEWYTPMTQAYSLIQLYASAPVSEAAYDVMIALAGLEKDAADVGTVHEATARLGLVMRQDLTVEALGGGG